MPGLYVIATPIGNRADMSMRAIDTLKQVDMIAAEDTRHARTLLDFHHITTSCISLHKFNEKQRSEHIIGKLKQGQSIALISDAGTPLISDPGQIIVKCVRSAGFAVYAVPGACAAIAALSIAGIDTSSFLFLGFAPHKGSAREHFIKSMQQCCHTIVCYESCHRIMNFIESLQRILGAGHTISLVKELTKIHETCVYGAVADILKWLEADQVRQKGEFVVVISGSHIAPDQDQILANIDTHLKIFLADLPVKQATQYVCELLGVRKKQVYERALQLKETMKDS